MSRVSHVTIVPLGGMAGDMFAAALLDALPDEIPPLMLALRAVLPGDLPMIGKVTSGGIAARRFTVPPQGRDAPIQYPDLDGTIAGAALPTAVANHARAILRLLAEAEARVHRIPVDHVHFHEIADWDTLADMVAAGHLIDRLDGAAWQIDPMPIGGGVVQTAHGLLAVPAPATAVLLQGLPVQDDGISGERVTPTGAAIARYVSTALPSGRGKGRLAATGYGAGARSLPGIANVLIARLVGEEAAAGTSQVAIIEFDIDDMTAEELAEATERLRRTPDVIDLVTFPLSGKKGRTASGFRLIVTAGMEEIVADACFAQTSTIGLRLRHERRVCLPRTVQDGRPRVKRVRRPDGSTTAKIEADDLTGDTLADRRSMARKAEG